MSPDPQPGRLRMRMTVEGVLAVAAAALALITIIDHEWIEELTGLEPDAGSGALEWAIVLGLAAAAVVLGVLAWRDGQRLRQTRA